MTKIYEASNHLLIAAGYDDPIAHSHMAAHIIICMDGDMNITVNGESYRSRGIMIPSGIMHQINTNGKNTLVFLYDSTTDVAKTIKTVKLLSETVCNSIATAYIEFEKNPVKNQYTIFETYFLNLLEMNETKNNITDERVVKAIKYIRVNISEKLSCKEVADVVCLSQSRFSHLFREQVGMTFASYVVYQRILHVYTAVFDGKSITTAAIEAGFSSAAHFSDVHRRVFGLPIRNVTRDCSFTKV